MTRDELQGFIVQAINFLAAATGNSQRVSAERFGKEIHVIANRDGDPTDRAFYRLTLHARRGGSR